MSYETSDAYSGVLASGTFLLFMTLVLIIWYLAIFTELRTCFRIGELLLAPG